MAIHRHNGIEYSDVAHHEDYKYRLEKTYTLPILIYPDKEVGNSYIKLTGYGELTIRKNYYWDGPSDPAPDLRAMMRASLVHDALYQLMRERQIGQGRRRYADQLFRDLCEQDGLGEWAAELAYWALRKYGAEAARPL